MMEDEMLSKVSAYSKTRALRKNNYQLLNLKMNKHKNTLYTELSET